MPHWHDDNPWADAVVYVPMEELAEAVAGGPHESGTDGASVEQTLAHWRAAGPRLDAYVLPQPDGRHSVGIRYGAEGHEYLSPLNRAPDRVAALADLYAAASPAP
jgi:hypothetical protein